jgi:uncharacterized repeat protein (TIGR03806 family)
VRFRMLYWTVAGCLLVLASESPAQPRWTGKFEPRISAYRLLEDNEAQIPSPGLVPYDLITPLFTDYAVKHRFIYLPPGASAEYRDYEPFAFPVGTVLVKTFSYPRDFRDPDLGRRLVETRLMFHTAEGWTAAAYVWNDQQTDADLKVAGKSVPVEWIDHAGLKRRTDYLVPNMNQCKACHRGFGETAPLGPTARQLNREYTYPSGSENQLAYWSRKGILRGAPDPDRIAALPPWNDPGAGPIFDRVRGYLDINCAHCHNPAGLASHTALDLRFEQRALERRGLMHRPTAAGNAARGRYYAVAPGNPEGSFLLHRLRSTAPDVRMPPIGRTIAHDEGAALIAEWIASLTAE